MNDTNLKSLAKELGLSVSTVSRALRDTYDISEKTKKKVRALADKRNYVTNPYASSLRKHQSKTIGVVIPNVVNNFFALAINGIESIAQQKNYHVLIYLTHENYEKETFILKHLQSGRVDGILLSMASETRETMHIESFRKNGHPVVFFDRVSQETDAPKITTDDYNSAYAATEHLVANGCTNIAHLCISKSLSITRERFRGYADALTYNNIKTNPSFLIECGEDDAACYQQIAALLRAGERPDGIFASVEKLAIITYKVCNDLGLNIPDDLKIISFSNLPTASLLCPSLTIIKQPAYDIGKEAAAILFRHIEKKEVSLVNQSTVLKSEMIVGKSSIRS